MSPNAGSFDLGKFTGSNRLRVEPPWSLSQIDWWRERMFEPFGAYPDDLVGWLAASSDVVKTATFSELDP
jgi:hypothetical protein